MTGIWAPRNERRVALLSAKELVVRAYEAGKLTARQRNDQLKKLGQLSGAGHKPGKYVSVGQEVHMEIVLKMILRWH